MSRFKRTKEPKRTRTTFPSRAGRPSNYNPDIHPKQARTVCELFGAKHVDLAKVLGVSKSCVSDWMTKHPEFKSAIKEGKDIFDSRNVEECLLTRAMGYEYIETREREVVLDGLSDEGVALAVPAREIVTTTKQRAPDITAQIFWLKNRQPDRWRDVRAVDVTKNTKSERVVRYEFMAGLKVDLDKIGIEDLEKLRNNITQLAASGGDDPGSDRGLIDVSGVESSGERSQTLH